MLTGQNGILQRASEVKEQTEAAQTEEQNILNSYEDKINEYVGIDWDTVLANAEMHPDQKNSTAIGVGTDGRAVNMDLWKYTKLDDGTYGLNDQNSYDETLITAGYIADENNDGIIDLNEDGSIKNTIPQYIKAETDNAFIKVTSLKATFLGLSALKIIPDIPNTVNDLEQTFKNCTSINKMPTLSSNISNMKSTFYGCTNLSELEDIPENVLDLSWCFSNCNSLISCNISLGNNVTTMQSIFQNCSSLISFTSKIPGTVINMQNSFNGCIKLIEIQEFPSNVENITTVYQNCNSLINPPSFIPSSVKQMQWAFQYCYNLNGTIKIDAKFDNETLINDRLTYANAFGSAATSENATLTLECPSNTYTLFYDSSHNRISSDLCSTPTISNIVLKNIDI